MIIVTMGCIHLPSRASIPSAKSLAYFPTLCRDWRMTSQERFDDDILSVLKPTDYLSRSYENGIGTRIGLYVGYHDGGKNSGDIHSPKNCLPGSGWHQLSSQQVGIGVPRGTISLTKAVYQKGENRELFLYWFQVRDKSFSDEYSLKLAEISNAVMHGRKDASFIRVSVPFEDNELEAEAAGIRFIQDVYPLIQEYLPV
jgi:EpsI family protein